MRYLLPLALLVLAACCKDDPGEGLCYCPDAGLFDVGSSGRDAATTDVADAATDAGSD